jgi:hypothetical protein
MASPSHRTTDAGDKVVIHDLEVFCAYDPRIDGDHDADLEKFDNDRVKAIVKSTRQYMAKGSNPQLVVMHERNGDEPKSCVGRFTKIDYQERNGVGYIVGDCEVERSVFERLLATNAFPRRSAEIWQDQNHLSEVALLGRETPRRPLPDTNFARKGVPVTFARPMRFDMGAVGGGSSTYIPGTKDTNMADDKNDDGGKILAEMKKLYEMACARFGDAPADDEKLENEADDMLATQFAEEEGDGDGVHIDIDSHGDEDEDEDEGEMFPAARAGRGEWFAMKRENARLARDLAEMKAQLTAERFGRELDAMESEGYRIPAARRPRLIADLVSSKNPEALIESWRELFTRDATGVRVDMSRATVGAQDINKDELAALVRQHAGNPAEFAKAINARTKR